MDAEIMTGDASYSFDSRHLTGNGTSTDRFEIPTLPGFSFAIRAMKSNGLLHVNVYKIPKKVLTCGLKISVLSRNEVLHELHRPLHKWGDGSYVSPGVSVDEALSRIEIKCEIYWLALVCSLLDAYKPFLLQSSFSDVQIIIGEEQLPAHKLILVAHSSVLKTMFESDMEEARENKVVIKDITSDVMKNVLDFLYTGCDKSLDNPEMALKMLFVAEKYDMKNLKDRCECKLSQQLTTSNVVKCLDVSDLNNAETLKAQCLKFMVENKRAVVANADFESLCLRKPKLICDFVKIISQD